MQIYTSECGGTKLEILKELGLGVMLSPLAMTRRDYTGIPLALDNGAFRSWRLGYPFMERLFLNSIEKGYTWGLPLEFIVCPDLIARGMESLRFSVSWSSRLAPCPRLALAVQDGMSPGGIHDATADVGFSHLFVGGTKEWKWSTAKDWVQFAKDHGLKCHIGRCGTLSAIEEAARLGVDSVDSSNIARNDSWEVVRQYQSPQHLWSKTEGTDL